MHEVVDALDFDGLAIGARPRRDADGRPRDRDAGWVAFWPADENRWMVEFARPVNERHIYLRFRLGEVVQTWPWTDAVQLFDEGWIMAPEAWSPDISDLRSVAEEVLAHLQSISPSQVDLIRRTLRAAADGQSSPCP